MTGDELDKGDPLVRVVEHHRLTVGIETFAVRNEVPDHYGKVLTVRHLATHSVNVDLVGGDAPDDVRDDSLGDGIVRVEDFDFVIHDEQYNTGCVICKG